MWPERELRGLLGGADDAALFAEADARRREVFADVAFVRGIVEFSNHCNKHCAYCGLRADNRGVERYRLEDADILAAAKAAVAAGAGTVVLQSGDDFACSARRVGALVRELKARHRDLAVTLSLGDRHVDEYAHWRDCGADRALLKLETGDPKRYAELRCGESFEDRLERLLALRSLGYEIGSGVISGLPGATLDDAVRDVRLLAALDLDMIAVGPFVPHPDTPLGRAPAGDAMLSLRMTAVLRLLCPRANIPATSALDAVAPGGRRLGLARGCNVIMPSATPGAHRADYSIYPGKNILPDETEDGIPLALATIRAAGYRATRLRGDAPRRLHEQSSAARRAPGHHPDGQAQRGQVVAD